MVIITKKMLDIKEESDRSQDIYEVIQSGCRRLYV